MCGSNYWWIIILILLIGFSGNGFNLSDNSCGCGSCGGCGCNN